MARKTGETLRSPQKGAQRLLGGEQLTIEDDIAAAKSDRRRDKSWASLGVDTSMTACSVVGTCYDAVLDKYVGPFYAEMRWMPEDEYLRRLGDAARGHELILDVLGKLNVPINIDRVYIAIEEPFPLGMIAKSVGGKKAWQGSYIKQQCEVAGAFKGSLIRYGYQALYEINNSQWKAVLRRDGAIIRKMDSGGKWDVKTWAVKAFGLPDLPDLVKSKSGAKIPRPESGYGAKAKPVQPNDVYDAAAVAAWMQDLVESGGV